MLERLFESWLDSASERSYQSAFCQMLALQGHRIVHSTRHGAMEQGKDVVTIAPDGIPCAFQLKGNPGTRLTLLEYRGIEGQLRQLTDQALPYPDLANQEHRSYLVTNGLVEEETTAAIGQYNQGQINAGYPNRQLLVIQRGELLDWANQLGYSLWPSGIGDVRDLLEMLVEDGRARYPSERWNRMLAEVLGLGDTAPNWSAAEQRRRIGSAGILTAVCAKNFQEAGNHWAVLSAWVQFAVAAIGSCERLGRSYKNNAAASVSIAVSAVRDALAELAAEVIDRDVLTEGDPLSDGPFYRPRCTLVAGLLSVAWLWNEAEGWPQDLPKDELARRLHRERDSLLLWGEGAVPQLLAYYWFLRRTQAGAGVDMLLAGVLGGLCRVGPDGDVYALPDPYWDVEDVIRHQLSALVGTESDGLAHYLPSDVSFFAEPLLHLLVRTNLKGVCQRLWPNVSRLQFSEFVPARPWQYCLPHSEEGTTRDVLPPLNKRWVDLVDEARQVRITSVPAALVDQPFLLWLYVILFPFRARPDVVRHAGFVFNKVWAVSGDPIT